MQPGNWVFCILALLRSNRNNEHNMKPVSAYWHGFNFVSIALSPFSLVYCVLVFLRRQLYRSGLLSVYRSRSPLIVVGNIYIGGNGKTPLVIELSRQLQALGYRPGIVSRGYGAQRDSSKTPFPRQVQDNNVLLYGDEPVVIYQATGCPVFIDPVRSRAVQAIEQKTDCNVIISDDGLQHYAMQRDIEINVSDARRLYGNGLCLPAGPLREPVSRLKSVDYIVYNISRGKLKQPLNLPAKSAHVYTMDYKIGQLHSVGAENDGTQSQTGMTLNDFKGKIVHAVAAIGDPDAFFRQLKRYGLELIEHPYPDHAPFTEQMLNFKDQKPIIMTQKDAVKCHFFKLENAWYLPVQADIDKHFFDCINQQLQSLKH